MKSLSLKLILSFLIISLAGTLLTLLLSTQFTRSEFDRFRKNQVLNNFTTSASQYYQTNGSWKGIEQSLQNYEGPINNFGKQPGLSLQTILLIDPTGKVITPAGHYKIGDSITSVDIKKSTPITINDKVIGRALIIDPVAALNPRELDFIGRTNRALVLSAIGSILFALLIGILLTRTLTHPLRELTSAIQKMAKGELHQQVPVRSKDELGTLTQAFNQMSSDLDYSNQLRIQMVADTAHELRTPLTVITGYLESMKDGVLPATPDRLDIIYDESQHLSRLVDDLRTLSLADAGELKIHPIPTAPTDLVTRVQLAFQPQAHQKNIHLETVIDTSLKEITIDPDRMNQVLSNLVSNSLRYTPSGGKITLSAHKEGDSTLFEVADTGTGITTEVIPHVFERFYRADRSRQHQGNESGLGLAIARSIVELHGGTIQAFSAGIGQGTTIRIRI